MPGLVALAEPGAGRRLVLGLVGLVVVLDVAFLVTLGIHRFVTEIVDVKLMFDLGQERNVPTWANTMLLLLVAASFLLVAALSVPGDRPSRRSLTVAGVAVTMLSIDEAAQLHELAGAPTARALAWWGIDLPTYAWVVPGAAVAAVGAAATVRWARTLPPEVGRRLLLALAVYGGAALGVEAVNGWLVGRDAEYPYVAGTLVEETLEMLACVLALTAVWGLLDVRDGALRRRHTPASCSEDGVRREAGRAAASA